MPCLPPSSLSRVKQRRRRQRLAVDRDRIAALEIDLDILRLVGRLFRGDGAAVDVFLGLDPGVFEHLALGRDVQEVGVDRERRLAALVAGDRDLVPLGVIDQPGARGQVPFAPRRDDLDVRRERVIAQLEAHLVVALAGRAVRHRIGAGLARDLDLALGDQRPRDRGAEQVLPFVERVGAEHRKDEIADELLAQIVDEDLAHPHHLGLPARRLQLLALAEIGGEGDDLAAIGLLQPAQDHRGVEPARIGQHDFFDIGRHLCSRYDCARRAREARVTNIMGGNADENLRADSARLRLLPPRFRCWRRQTTTAFDGTYRGVSRQLEAGSFGRSARSCALPDGVPGPLTIVNGVARAGSADSPMEGSVTPQGVLTMRSPRGGTFQGSIDGQGRATGRYNFSCSYQYVWQRR